MNLGWKYLMRLWICSENFSVNPSLQYFDTNEVVTVLADASNRFEAVLMQDNQPVACESASLTETW